MASAACMDHEAEFEQFEPVSTACMDLVMIVAGIDCVLAWSIFIPMSKGRDNPILLTNPAEVKYLAVPYRQTATVIYIRQPSLC
jgi:hypothetical protein